MTAKLVASVIAAIAISSCATMKNDAPLKVILATATPGGGFPVCGAAFKAAIESTAMSTRQGVPDHSLLHPGVAPCLKEAGVAR